MRLVILCAGGYTEDAVRTHLPLYADKHQLKQSVNTGVRVGGMGKK